MSVVIGILGWSIVAILVIFILSIATPLRIELQLNKDQEWRFSVALRLFGGLGPRMPIRRRKSGEKAVEKRTAKPKKRRGFPLGDPGGVLKAVLRFGGDILRCVRINSATLDAVFGFGDPAETGQAYGLLAPLIYCPVTGHKTQISITPAFDRKVFNGRATLDLSFIPVALLVPILRLAWTNYGARR